MTLSRPVPLHHRRSVESAAAHLECSAATIYRLIRAGRLPAYKVGRSTFLDSRDLDAYLAGIPVEAAAR